MILVTTTAVSLILTALFTTLTRPLPAAQGSLSAYETVVVRATFSDHDMVNEVARFKEPWDVNRQQQYIIIDVTPDEYTLLEQIGFQLEIDEAATAVYHHPPQRLPNQQDGIPGRPCYRTVEETFASALAISSTHPALAEWLDIGDSWEKVTPGGAPGYDLMVLRLTNENMTQPKPKLFAISALHAREYATAELLTRFAEYLVNQYGQDADATWLLDHHEIHLLLQANPDGRKHAETGLSWRKNTNNNTCTVWPDQRGVDLNRNFSFGWNCCGGSSGDVCDSTYRGPGAASEPETQAIQDYTRAQFTDLRPDDLMAAAPLTTTGIFLDIHSFSELVLWPWGNSQNGTPNDTALVTLGRKLAYFNNYEPQQAIDLYLTDGTTDDFAYGELGLPAFTYELGTAFFQGCDVFEDTIYPDNLPSLLYAAKAVREPYLAPAGPDVTALSLSATAVTSGTDIILTATLDDTRYNNILGTEPSQPIQAAEAYLDTPPWITTTTPISLPLTAVDGTFDSVIESARTTIDTSGLSNGRHLVFVRGQDANGSWGVFSAIFLNITPAGGFNLYYPIITFEE